MGRFDFAKIYGEDAVPKRQTIEQEIFRLRADSKTMRAAIRETLNRARNEDGECLLGYIVKPLEDFE